jgi:hypothetical protein
LWGAPKSITIEKKPNSSLKIINSHKKLGFTQKNTPTPVFFNTDYQAITKSINVFLTSYLEISFAPDTFV